MLYEKSRLASFGARASLRGVGYNWQDATGDFLRRRANADVERVRQALSGLGNPEVWRSGVKTTGNIFRKTADTVSDAIASTKRRMKYGDYINVPGSLEDLAPELPASMPRLPGNSYNRTPATVVTQLPPSRTELVSAPTNVPAPANNNDLRKYLAYGGVTFLGGMGSIYGVRALDKYNQQKQQESNVHRKS